MPFLHTIATALPENTITTDEAVARLAQFFVTSGEDRQLVESLFANTGIDQRYLARPASFYLQERSLTARNAVYNTVAPQLGIAAARRALDQAGLRAADVDLIIDTSCTGVMIPALDVHVANALGFRPNVRRIPLTEAGCAAGATSLALASELLGDKPDATALLVSVELPSLTLQLDDTSRANLVSSAIFGDGAAAVVVSNREPKGPAFELLEHQTTLFPDTTDIMGFDLKTEGFQIVLSKRIPLLVRKQLRGEVDAFLESHGLSLKDIGFHVIHPGGTKVLDNVRDVLGLEEADVAPSREVLRRYGNLSSASVHFVAKEILERDAFPNHDFGLLIAMGPGFTVELALVRGRA